MQRSLVSLSISAEGLALGGRRLFPGLRFVWRKGEHWGVVGPNGCGKSVLARLLSGALFAPEAEIGYGFSGPRGGDPERAVAVVSLERQAQLLAEMDAYVQMRWIASEEEATPTLGAWLSQDSVEDVDPWERVERTPRAVAAFARRRGRVVREMGLGGLLDRHLVSLSNGETRRALLARALLAAPRLLLFDAPYVGLDAASRRILASAVDRTVAAGSSAVMLATVRREELPCGLTHILELDAEGRVVRQGPVERSNGRTIARSHSRTVGPSDRSTVGPAPPTRWVASGPPPDPRARKLVEMRDVLVVYGERVVFENLDWTVRAGERWLVAGPNGSGKTTLLAFVIGDHPQAYANDVRLFGVRRGTGESIWSIKRRIGWVSPELHACMDRGASVLDTVLSGLDDTPYLNGSRTPARVRRAREALASVGLSGAEAEPFGALSGGAQRLALLARAVVKRPPLLVLDEPCQNLDRPNRERFVALVDRLCADPATTLLYVTHLADTEPRCITHRLVAAPSR